MAIKALALGIVGVLALSETTCGKSTAEDASRERPQTAVVLEGVDTAALTAREKNEWGQYVSEFLSPCQNAPVPIAQCVKEKRACSKCLPAAKYVLRGVKDGLSRDQIEAAYKNRFDADKVKNVPIDGSPTVGPDNAPITIVEFADFECPHCGEVAPLLDKLVESHKGDIRFVFKMFPLPGHPHAEPAARAAVAAGKQGKFWEMHHKLFANQHHLEQTDIDSYAKELGLDVSRLHADMQANETSDRIAKDRKLGEDLKIQGTPSIFINGRSYDMRQDMGEWITLEMQVVREGGSTTAPTSATIDAGKTTTDAGAKPAGSASAPAKDSKK